MTRTKRAVCFLVVFAVVLSGCAMVKPTKATVGQAILDLGSQFLSTAKLYDAALTQGAITREQYNAFAEFAAYFKPVYLGAAKAYEAGTQTPDELRRVIRELNDELALYAISRLPKKETK